MGAHRGQHQDGALKTIEGVNGAVHHHLEGFLVVLAASFTFGHGSLLFFDRQIFLLPGFKAAIHFHDREALLGELHRRLGREMAGR